MKVIHSIIIPLTLLLTQGTTSVLGILDQGDRSFLIEAVKEDNEEIIYWLLERGAKLDVQDEAMRTPLMHAVTNGAIDVVMHLVEAGAWIDTRDANGMTAFHLAALKGDIDMLSYLRNYGNYLNSTNLVGRTPLHFASEEGHVDAVNYLMNEGESPLVGDENELTSVHIAAMKDRVPVLKLFKNSSIDIDISTITNKTTPLTLAVMSNKTKAVKYLIQSGAMINISDANNWTLLHAASSSGNIEFIKLFQNSYSSLDCQDKQGRTPLFAATLEGHIDAVKFLIDQGSNESVVDDQGNSVRHAAVKSGNLNLVKYFEKKSLSRRKGTTSPLNTRNKIGTTPLIMAAERGDLEIVKYLARNRYELNSSNWQGYDVMHAAARSNNAELVQYLIKTGVTTCNKNIKGMTPIHYASIYSSSHILNLLMEATTKEQFSSNPLSLIEVNMTRECVQCYKTIADTKDNFGRTPIYLAAKHGNLPALKLLFDYGGDFNQIDLNGSSPLHTAAQNNKIDVLKLLIVKQVDINLRNNEGETPLFLATKSGHLKSISFLLENGANPFIRNVQNQSILHVAAAGGNLDIVKRVCQEKTLLDLADNFGKTPVWYAAYKGHLNCLSHLINVGASPSFDIVEAAIYGKHLNIVQYAKWNTVYYNKWRSMTEDPPLYIACSAPNGSAEIVKYLIQSGEDTNYEKNGKSLFEIATDAGNIDIIQELINNDVHVNDGSACFSSFLSAVENNRTEVFKFFLERGCAIAQTHRFLMLLHTSSRNGNVDIMKLIISNGVNVDAKDYSGNNALLYAIMDKEDSASKFLIDIGASVTTKNNENTTPVTMAIKTNNLDILKYIIDQSKNISLNQVDEDGKSLLHRAIEENSADIVNYLIESGADKSVKDNNGFEPIHYAVQHINILPILLDSGVNIESEAKHNLTPLQMAYKQNNVDAFKCLVKYGADTYKVDYIQPTFWGISETSKSINTLINLSRNKQNLDHLICK